MSVITVGVRELKNHLSQYLRRVEAGETVIITERGVPVGQIVPLKPNLAERLADLAQAGVVEWEGRSLPPYQPRLANLSQDLLSDLVIEDRV